MFYCQNRETTVSNQDLWDASCCTTYLGSLFDLSLEFNRRRSYMLYASPIMSLRLVSIYDHCSLNHCLVTTSKLQQVGSLFCALHLFLTIVPVLLPDVGLMVSEKETVTLVRAPPLLIKVPVLLSDVGSRGKGATLLLYMALLLLTMGAFIIVWCKPRG